MSETANFNSHAHVERDATAWQRIDVLWHFNSHAHVERDAPALLRYVHGGYFNSHAHVERDTFVPHCPPRPTYFNSHAHVERDPFECLQNIDTGISTHTLTWSVTRSMIFHAHRR